MTRNIRFHIGDFFQNFSYLGTNVYANWYNEPFHTNREREKGEREETEREREKERERERERDRKRDKRERESFVKAKSAIHCRFS